MSETPQVVITEFMDDAAVAKIADAAPTLYDPGLADNQDQIPALLGHATALIVRNRTQVRQVLLDSAPNLQAVGRLGVGLDNIDVQACLAHDVTVYPATGANDVAVAEYVITTAMTLLRGAYHATGAVADGSWPRNQLIGSEISGKVLGLIGFGSIARQTANRAMALGMNVVAHDPFVADSDPAWGDVRSATMDTVIAEADVLSLHTPLTDATRHLINEAKLASMKSSAILINAARGGVVDEAALASALRSGEISGAALDVFETEPLSPEAGQAFKDLNVLLTPHIAGVTQESNTRVSELIAAKILSHLGLQR